MFESSGEMASFEKLYFQFSVIHRMHYLFLVAICSMFLLSCTEVTFPEAQPRGVKDLKEVPTVLQGTYETYSKATGETGDTLIIESWGYRFKDKTDQDWLGRGVLSDTLVVKFYKDYYFVNFKDEDQWVLRVVRQKSPGLLEFLSIDLSNEAVRKEILAKLGGKLKIKEVKRGDNIYYQINPTPAQLLTLIKDGYFTGVELRKMK